VKHVKITKFVHSCLLVEMPEPINRTVLFDPGSMSRELLESHTFEYLDDIFVTHNHGDHMDTGFIKKLVAKFPDVRILATAQAIDQLKEQGITATNVAAEGVTIFDSEHAPLEPMSATPQQHGIHYLDKLTHPGDSHTFGETMPVLALPVQAPWGSMVDAVKLALKLKPAHIIPIHDWHWSDQARAGAYDQLEQIFAQNKIAFIKPQNGEPFVLDV
jgi:L-ascorbate metabolism protein UlaG (beta-lactamase superfamily)